MARAGVMLLESAAPQPQSRRRWRRLSGADRTDPTQHPDNMTPLALGKLTFIPDLSCSILGSAQGAKAGPAGCPVANDRGGTNAYGFDAEFSRVSKRRRQDAHFRGLTCSYASTYKRGKSHA